LKEYILFDASKNKIESIDCLLEKDNNKDNKKEIINETTFLQQHKNRMKNKERDQIDFSIRLANCQSNEMYGVSAVSHFTNFEEEPSLFSTDFQFPHSNGIVNLIDHLPLDLFYERKQFIKFSIMKKNENRKFTVKFNLFKLLMSKKDELEYVYNKETNEKIIINSSFLNESKVKMELQVRLKSINNTEELSGDYSYSLFKLDNERYDKNKENEFYISEIKKFSTSNDFSFRKINKYFKNFNNDLSKLFLGYKVCLRLFKTEIRSKNREKIILKEILLPTDSYKNSFLVNITDNINAEINLKYQNLFTFSQYLKRGLNMNMRISIDFTASNGNPLKKGSLHELKKNTDNPYEKAIKTCGEIVSQYDFDNIFPVYGYGAILPNEKTVSHCFNLNLTDDPSIKSIQKVLDVYEKITPKLTFKFPTYFSNSLRKVTESIKSNIKDSCNCYEVLLILTDGKVDDLEETTKAIVEASCLPLSIVIIGIGDRDFESMNKLECGEEFLVDSNGNKSLREIVHFVNFGRFEDDIGALAEAVFEKIPDQIVEYFTLKKIKPEDLK